MTGSTHRRRAIAPLLLLALLGTTPSVLAQPPAAATGQAALMARQLEGADRSAALAAASAALNRVASTRGRFDQIAPNGARTAGDFYLQRPGRLRFQYDAPSPLTIISDGSTVAIQDTSLKDTTRIPLRSTPLFYVLKRDVDLERDARITRVARLGDQLLITARDRTGEAEGELTLVFAASDYQLKEWSVTDGQRLTTRIVLSGLRAAPALDPKLFRLPTVTRARSVR